MISTCRSCARPLPKAPFLNFSGMPKAAQGFPKADELAGDRPAKLDIFECTGCGLVQANCEPVPYFREVIRATSVSADMKVFRKEFFRDFVARHGLKGRSVLEIGCGRGEYLDLLAEAGLVPFGTEYGIASVEHCRTNGFRVAALFPDDPALRIEGGPFGAFVSFNFMEHWPVPSNVLGTVFANTSEDAIGLVEVPNLDMMLRKGLFSEFISDHVSYFTAETLRRTLELNGFEVLSCEPIWFDYILSAAVKKRRRVDASLFESRRASLNAAVSAFLRERVDRGIAVWGAGHQALAAICLLNMGPHLRYVVDSAPFKQGRFTPASHLPIHPPSRLKDEPVGSVLIMGGGYSDEIAALVAREHAPELGIAILRETEIEVLR